MTEAESQELWQQDHHPQGMLWILHGQGKVMRTKVGRRKLRLFACGCSRLVWDQLTDRRHRDAVVVAERFADGLASKEELEARRAAIRGLSNGSYSKGDAGARRRTAARMAEDATVAAPFQAAFGMTAYEMSLAGNGGSDSASDAILCALIRCVFGNPFCPVAIDLHRLTSAVAALAQASTMSEPSTACRSWPTRSKTLAATTLRS